MEIHNYNWITQRLWFSTKYIEIFPWKFTETVIFNKKLETSTILFVLKKLAYRAVKYFLLLFNVSTSLIFMLLLEKITLLFNFYDIFTEFYCYKNIKSVILLENHGKSVENSIRFHSKILNFFLEWVHSSKNGVRKNKSVWEHFNDKFSLLVIFFSRITSGDFTKICSRSCILEDPTWL